MTDEAVTVKSVGIQRDSCMSLSQHFATVLAEHGSLVAQVQEVDGRVESRTYTDLLLQGRRVARFLRERGLESGDIVMFFFGNDLSNTPVMLGTLFIGAALAPMSYQCEVDMVDLLNVIQPALVICDTNTLSAMTEAVSQSDAPVPLVAMETVQLAMEDPGKDSEEFHLGVVEDPGSHVAFVMNSSGTSGKPKVIELSHRSYLLTKKYLVYRPSDELLGKQGVLLYCSRFYWGLALVANFNCLTNGIKQVLMDNFTEQGFLTAVEKYKVNYTMLVPPQLAALAQWPEVEQFDISSLKSVSLSGSAVSPVLVDQFEKKFGVNAAQFYGLTECLFLTYPAYDVTDKPGNAGKLCAEVELTVVDIDTGKPQGANCKGELFVRIPWLMKGYRNNPEATAAVLEKDGFFCTGDVGYVDQDGFLFVCGRTTDLIKYNELTVDVRAIEDVLLGHPDVQEVAVVGIYQEKDFEVATGFVIRRQGSEVTARQLEELVEAQLRAQNWLHGGVRFVDSIPKTDAGKVKKRLLREFVSGPADRN